MVFKQALAANPDERLEVPCGQCAGCRLEYSRQWAMRCVHEAQLHFDNSFITLTYDDENLPADFSLDKTHLQKFFKRLRKHYQPQKIRYYACGEYGDQTHRPHYHACLFGLDFEDKELWKIANGNRLYTSEILRKIWPYGYNVIGDVNFQTAAYVARYVMKKQTAKESKRTRNYELIDENSGEIYNVLPQFSTMSRRPGIASDWYKKFRSDLYPSDNITVNGQKMKPAKFYDRLLEIDDPELLDDIKKRRQEKAEVNPDNQPARLATRHELKKLQIKHLKRGTD